MECQRLQKLVKNWYLQVQSEAMAPARMVAFMENHLLECEACLADDKVREEVERIKAMILPPPKAGKTPGEEDSEEETETGEPEDEEDEDEEDDDDEEDDEI
ncbi:hypothetical protein [Desulfurivibrio alkaliphilus]|uniref:Uncharacterized protein n=1 Tax=Desulfurivibrio alkaliphilus (strain DSM 19089 / UNIQEM U267 / AHT2) TaxID=589865 RepID=D6Z5K0_DESAT|nr:hypothetical protein [Desulfurivibrio alkaliphilus]ADH86737.1 hypothetical protein DaAHT2_2064 [Desulfurivibrio alkaliphilus AHT 2]